jgi:hypothetical protein
VVDIFNSNYEMFALKALQNSSMMSCGATPTPEVNTPGAHADNRHSARSPYERSGPT